MSEQNEISQAAATLGHKGGLSTSPAKQNASRANGRLGGRPSLREKAEQRVNASPELKPHHDTIMYDWPEGNEHWRWVCNATISEIVDWAQSVQLFPAQDNAWQEASELERTEFEKEN